MRFAIASVASILLANAILPAAVANYQYATAPVSGEYLDEATNVVYNYDSSTGVLTPIVGATPVGFVTWQLRHRGDGVNDLASLPVGPTCADEGGFLCIVGSGRLVGDHTYSVYIRVSENCWHYGVKLGEVLPYVYADRDFNSGSALVSRLDYFAAIPQTLTCPYGSGGYSYSMFLQAFLFVDGQLYYDHQVLEYA